MRTIVAVALVLIVAAVAAPAHSYVIYDESVSGEFNGFTDPPVIFELVPGDGTFIGSSFFRQPTEPSNDSDIFGFVIQDSNQLTSIIFEYIVTEVFGDIRSVGLHYQLALTGADGTFNKTESISATPDVEHIYSDGSNPNTPVSPSE